MVIKIYNHKLLYNKSKQINFIKSFCKNKKILKNFINFKKLNNEENIFNIIYFNFINF